MQPLSTISAAWGRVETARDPQERARRVSEMDALLSNRINFFYRVPASYQPADLDLLERITGSMGQDPGFRKVLPKVEGLTTLLRGDPKMLRVLPPSLEVDPAALGAAIDRDDFDFRNFTVAELLLLLERGGEAVTHLDLSRLLTKEAGVSLNTVELSNLLQVCPNLSKLTLFHHRHLTLQDLTAVLEQAPARTTLQELTVACCEQMQDEVALKGAVANLSPQVKRIGFETLIPGLQVVTNLVKCAISADRFCALSEEQKKQIRTNVLVVCTLVQFGMDFDKFVQLPENWRTFILKHQNEVKALLSLGLPFERYMEISDTMRQRISQHSVTIGYFRWAGMRVDEFLRLPEEQQELLLHPNLTRPILVSLKVGRSLAEILGAIQTGSR